MSVLDFGLGLGLDRSHTDRAARFRALTAGYVLGP